MKRKTIRQALLSIILLQSMHLSLPASGMASVGPAKGNGISRESLDLSPYVLLFEDEFNGDRLNEEDWCYRLRPRTTDITGLNRKENVRLADGKLHIDFRLEDASEKVYSGGGVISRKLFHYGYYEVRCKLFGASPGLHSSFWLMGLQSDVWESMTGETNLEWPRENQLIEIDGYEIDSRHPGEISTGYHDKVGYKRAWYTDYYVVDSSEAYFTCGLEVLPNRINWYVNRKRVRTHVNPPSHAPQNLWLTALPYARRPADMPDNEALPGTSSWDYFRFYARDLTGVDIAANGGFEYNRVVKARKGIRTKFIDRDMQHPAAWMEKGAEAASRVEESGEAFEGDYVLKHGGTGRPYDVTTYQSHDFIRNATYKLSAMVRRTGGQEMSRMIVSGYGGGELTVDIPKSASWTEVVLDGIEVTTNSCTIGFASRGSGQGTVLADNVQFTQMTGTPDKGQFDPLVRDEAKDRSVYGVFSENATLEGAWGMSGVLGYRNLQSVWVEGETGSIQWDVSAPEDGTYRLSFYKLQYYNADPAVKVTVEADAQALEQTVNTREGEAGWVDLGTLELKKGANLHVEVTHSGRGTLRVNSIMLEKTGRKTEGQ